MRTPPTLARARLIRLGNLLGKRLRALAETLEDLARRIEYCPYCGENKFYGDDCRAVLGYMPGSDAAPTPEQAARERALQRRGLG
jgi:hypothetical protein